MRRSPIVCLAAFIALDAYAAGFLAAYTAGRDLAACGRLGSMAAAEIISYYGARPKGDLKARAGL